MIKKKDLVNGAESHTMCLDIQHETLPNFLMNWVHREQHEMVSKLVFEWSQCIGKAFD